MKKIAIMQPYFFPYIGYFQLIHSVDEFVIYDNIQFTKKGWINRNRILVNGKDDYISLPVKKDSDYLNVNQRFLSDTWLVDRKKMLNRVTESYRNAPHFKQIYPLFEKCLNVEKMNLFDFLYFSLKEVLSFIEVPTKIIVSSSIDIDHHLKFEQKVLAICKAQNATTYINPIGGIELYSKERFELNEITLQFQKSNLINYTQLKNEFVPWLSILDILMFNSKESVRSFLNDYQLL
jgi:hypothetical protein